jgi:hypothetical protein
MTRLAIIAVLLLTSCRGVQELIVTTPDEVVEGGTTAVDADPEDVAVPCDTLIKYVDLLRTDTVHDTVQVQLWRDMCQKCLQVSLPLLSLTAIAWYLHSALHWKQLDLTLSY